MMTFIKSKESDLGTTQTVVKFTYGDMQIVSDATGITLNGQLRLEDKNDLEVLARTIGEASQEWIKLRNCVRAKLSV